MHEYYVIKQKIVPVLEDAGLGEVIADLSVDVYGSIHSIFASAAVCILLGWDGEEGFGYAKTWEGNDVWRMLESKVPESAGAEFESNLDALSHELSQHLRVVSGDET